jgi:hypothetical protein
VDKEFENLFKKERSTKKNKQFKFNIILKINDSQIDETGGEMH